MSAGLTLAFVAAVLVAWLILGCTFAAAFKAPFVVLFPGLALILAHAVMFDNYAALPAMMVALSSLVGMYVFALMCLRVIIPKAEPEKDGGEAAKEAST